MRRSSDTETNSFRERVTMKTYLCAQCSENFTAPYGCSIVGTELFLCRDCAAPVACGCLSDIEIPKPKMCLVAGCTNISTHGPHHKTGKELYICGACLNMLKDGKIGPTDSFLKDMCPCNKFDNVAPNFCTGAVSFGFIPEAPKS